MLNIYTETITETDQILVPSEVRNLLIRKPSDPNVVWNYHTEEPAILLSNTGFVPDSSDFEFEDYVFATTTKVTD